MSRFFGAIAVTMLFALVGTNHASAQASTPKIAYIKSQTILQQTPQREVIAAQMKKEMAPLEARISAMNDSNVKIVDAYQKDEPTLTPEARTRRQREIADKQQAWTRTADSLRSVAEQRQAELEQPMLDLLRKILTDIRAEEGYWLIYDADAPGHGIVAIDRNLEITDRVLARYKVAAASLPKPDSSKAATGAPVPTTTGVGRKIPPSP